MSNQPDKHRAILFGPFIGEMYWEFARFAPILPFKVKEYKNQDVKFIVFTRPDRFDIYGRSCDILVPLRIDGDGYRYKPDSFRMMNYPITEYQQLALRFKQKYLGRFSIMEHIYPNICGKNFANRNQFSPKLMKFKWKPRVGNQIAIENYVGGDDRRIVVLAPRYRQGLRRNWPYWDDLYDLIDDDKKLNKEYRFVICGKHPDYVPDRKDRFLDVNRIEITDDISLIGLTIELIRKSVLVVGSQSAIPNMALNLKVPVLEWGHQRSLHIRTYNMFNTPVRFLDDQRYKMEAKRVIGEIGECLKSIEIGKKF